MSHQNVTSITNYDPLRNLLTGKFRLTPFSFGLLIFVLDLIVDGLLGYLYGKFHTGSLFITSSGPPGLLQDYMAIIADFIYTPIIAGLYLWSVDGTNRVFQQLITSNVFKSNDTFLKAIDKTRTLYNNKNVFYVITAFSVLFSFSQIGAYTGLLPWITVGGYIDVWPTASFGRAPFWFLMFYFLSYTAFNVGVTIIILRQGLNSTNLQLTPLHPDNCGGLGSISQYSNKIALGIGSIGLIFSAAVVMQIQNSSLSQTYPVIIGVVVYLIFAPLFFFLPLGTAHDAMQEAKETELLKLAKQFREIYGKVKLSAGKSYKKFDDELKNLENLKKLYQVAESFPVWPFDVKNLRRFVTIVTTPLLPAISEIIRINDIIPKIINFFKSFV